MKLTGAAIGAGVGAAGVGAAQTPAAVETPEWDEVYNNDDWGDDSPEDIVSTRDGGYAVLGTSDNFLSSQYFGDLWLVKIDEDGNEEWSETYRDDDYYYSAAALVETRRPNGYALLATRLDRTTRDGSIWFGRTNSNGNLGPTHTYEYSDDSYDLATDMVAHKTGRGSRRRTSGFAIFGATPGTDISRERDFYLLRIGLDGSLDWDETYSYADNSFNEARGGALVKTADGGYALFGTTYSTTGSENDYYLQKTDQNGDPEWSQSYDRDTTQDHPADLVERRSGGETTGYVLVGTSHSAAYNNPVYWALRLDDEGGVQRSQTYQCRDHNQNYAAALTRGSNGDGYAILGTTYLNDTIGSNYCVVRTNNDLEKQWDREYDYDSNDWATSIVQTDDGYTLAGHTHTSDGADFWIVRISE